MGPILLSSILTLPVLAILLIPSYDKTGKTDSRTRLAGLRTSQTLASREAWDAAHAWARRPLRRLVVATAVVLALAVTAELTLPLSEAATAALLLGEFLFLFVGVMVITWRAHRVAADVNRRLGIRF